MHKFQICLLFIGLLAVSTGYSQSDSMIVKNDKLYINKHLPLYMHLSASPEPDAPSVKLKGTQNDRYTNPFYLDTEGKNTIYPNYGAFLLNKSSDRYMSRLLYAVYADGLPPSTSHRFNNAQIHLRDGERVYKKGLTVRLRAIDGMSGIKATYYGFDGETFQEYREPITPDTAGRYELYYYSTDYVGNIEKPKKVQFIIE